MVHMMNEMPGAAINIRLDRNSVKQLAFKQFEHQILIQCERCDDLVIENTKCNKCKRLLLKDSKKCNFLAYIPFEQQIRFLLDKYFDIIVAYLNREHSNETLSDVDDGKLFKKISANHSSVKVLSLTINVDGANIHKSSNKSLWPLAIGQCNFISTHCHRICVFYLKT